MKNVLSTQTIAGMPAYLYAPMASRLVAPSMQSFVPSFAAAMPRRHSDVLVATPWCADLAVAGLTAGKACATATKATAFTAAATGTATTGTKNAIAKNAIAKKRPCGRGGPPLG